MGAVSSFDYSGHNDPDDEHGLLTRIREGDADALVVLMRTYAPMLVRFAASRVQDIDEAQDLVQEVFVLLWQRRETLEIRGSIKAYLFQATQYRVVSFMRSLQSRKRLHDSLREISAGSPDGSVDGSGQLEVSELTRIIQTAIERLRPRTREIFLLSRQQGLTYAEIAEVLSISLGTVHNQMSQATRALAEVVSRWRETKR